MNKKIRKIVAIALAVGTVSAVAPASNLNLLLGKASASENTEHYLDSLKLVDGNGNKIKIYDDDDYTQLIDDDEVEKSETYYVKTSSNTLEVLTDGPSDRYVRVFKSSESYSRAKEIGEDIRLDQDSEFTTLIIKVYGEEPHDDMKYGDNSDYDVLSTYKIKVQYVEGDSENTSNTYDDIYLERLSIDGQMIELSDIEEDKYTFHVDQDTDKVTIRATPEDDDYDVSIDGEEAEYDDNYKVDVNLDKGANKFEIEIENDDEKRVYTLIINRGITTSTTNTESINKKSQWVQVNGKWQYNDSNGNVAKNMWIQNYFLDASGNRAVGWINYNGIWYYLGTDGIKKTGWQYINGNWYYLDTVQGMMLTGWMRDVTDGQYYYLNSDGTMAYNTTINGYRLGQSGAWIK